MISRIARLRGTYGPGFREKLGIRLIPNCRILWRKERTRMDRKDIPAAAIQLDRHGNKYIHIDAGAQSMNIVLYSALEADLGAIL